MKTEKEAPRYAYQPRYVSSSEIAIGVYELKRIKFYLEFMVLMREEGRLEEATQSYDKAYRLVCDALDVEGTALELNELPRGC